MNIKKLAAAIIVFIMAGSVPTYGEAPVTKVKDVVLYQAGEFQEGVSLMEESGDVEGAKRAIEAAIRNFETEADVSEYKISSQAALGAAQYVINDNPELFYVSGMVRVSYYPSTGMAVKVLIEYDNRYDKESIPELLKFVEDEADKALSYIDDSMTDYDKALAIHDYLVVNHSYDVNSQIRNIYEFFKEGKGVCQGYAQAYAYLLKKCGVEVGYALSDEMDHMWNMVKIDGEWYHVDVTFDDPLQKETGDVFGYCGHTYFMKSDSYMMANKYHDWTAEGEAKSAAYDESPLAGLTTATVNVGGVWYGTSVMDFNTRVITELDILTGERKNVKEIDVSGAPYDWRSYAGCINLAKYDDYLIYSTYDKVAAFKPGEEAEKIVLKEENLGANGIAGITVKGEKLTYSVAKDRYASENEIREADINGVLDEKWPEITNVEPVIDDDGVLRLDVTLQKDTFGEKAAAMAAAVYRGGEMIGVVILNEQFDRGERELSVRIPSVSMADTSLEGAYAKVFVLKSVESAEAVGEAAKCDLDGLVWVMGE